MWIRLFTVFLVILAVVGCRGQISEQPPIHLNPNMDDQPAKAPQSASPLFADGRADREPIPSTLAATAPRLEPVLLTGKNPDGSWVLRSPVPVTVDLLRRGQERYNIYCAACHDRAGTGQGMVIRRTQQNGTPGFPPPPSYLEERIMTMPDGQFFDLITHGVRTMPSYRHQIPVPDRWAIIAYIHALQRAQQTTLRDVPPQFQNTLEGNP